MALCGGFSAVKEVDDETRALFESSEVLARVNSLLGVNHSALKVVSFKTQVVRAVLPGPSYACPLARCTRAG